MSNIWLFTAQNWAKCLPGLSESPAVVRKRKSQQVRSEAGLFKLNLLWIVRGQHTNTSVGQQHQNQECQEGSVWLKIIKPGCWHTDSPCPMQVFSIVLSECGCLHKHKGDPVTRIESNNSHHALLYCWHLSPWCICEEMSGDTMCYKITAWWIQMWVQHRVPQLIWCRVAG